MATVPISELIIVLHQCNNSLQQRYNFFMNRQKGGEDFIEEVDYLQSMIKGNRVILARPA